MTEFNPFFHQFLQTARLLTKNMNEHLLHLDLFSSQWSVIYYIKNNGPATQAELCQYLTVEAPTMTRTITRMETAGWVRKSAGRNKREKFIELTDIAMETYPLWKDAVRTFESKAMDRVKIEDQIQTIATLNQIMDNLKKQE